jgi:hypothetical protein
MSKTGHWDESLVIDDKTELAFLDPFLSLLRQGDGDLPLWPFRHSDLVATFRRSSESLGLSRLEPCLYSLRHAGASADWLTQSRTLAEIKVRGRWSSDASLRRYQKAAQAQQELELVPAPMRNLALAGLRDLGAVFHSPSLARSLVAEIQFPIAVDRPSSTARRRRPHAGA